MTLLKIFLISGYLFGTAHASVKAMSLNEYLAEVKKENTTIEASKLRALSQKHKIKPGSTLDDPFIAAGLDEIPFDGGRAKVRRYQISQSIPFPGKLSARSEIAETKAETSEFESLTVARQMQVLATQVYLRASYNKQEIDLNQKIQKIIEETTASAKARYRTGDSSHHEWLLAKLELSILNVELLRLKRTQKSLTALLNELRNKPADSQIEVDYRDLLDAADETKDIQVNLDSQPELLGWRAQKRVSEAELKLSKLSYAPDFVIQGMAMQPTMKDAEMSEPANWGVMVGVTIPLYFWRKQSELVSSAENDRLATLSDYQSLQNRLNTEIADAKQQLQTSLDVVKLYKNDVIPITEIAVKNARISYASKTLPMRQLLDALRSQRTQELELLAAQMDVVVAKTRMTELLSNPPVTRFAPTRPTLFGGGSMESSGPVNMGSGISAPTQKQNAQGPNDSSSGGMGGGM
ncbi:MAG: TolC family protein [Bacteriovorax sp.]|jgi:outer membrane protein TolC